MAAFDWSMMSEEQKQEHQQKIEERIYQEL
jgi:hypothetical protein